MSGPRPDRPRHLLRQMLRIRRLEETCVELYSAAKIRGFLHVQIGEEAVAAGVMSALGPGRRRRRHLPRARARAAPRRRRRSRSSPRCTASRRAAAGAAAGRCTCSTPPPASTAATPSSPAACRWPSASPWPTRCRAATGSPRCFFGDGAVAEGEFHESLNLAALWQLPVLFVLREQPLRDGHRARGTPSRRPTSRSRPPAYEIPAWPADGMDALAVAEAARRAVDAVRSGGGPHFLELRTYRFRAHSMFDPERYRDKAEVGQLGRAGPDRRRCARACRPTAASPTRTGRRCSRRSTRRCEQAVAFAEAGTARAGRGAHPVRLQRAAGHGRRRREDHLPRGDARGDPRGDAARRPGLPHGRGRRALRRLLRRQPRPAGGVRPRADPRHPAVGVGVHRRRHRGRPGRHAADRRDHDGQLQPAGAGPDHEQRGDPAAHVRRASSTCRSSSG